jgi:hypothetical protein
MIHRRGEHRDTLKGKQKKQPKKREKKGGKNRRELQHQEEFKIAKHIRQQPRKHSTSPPPSSSLLLKPSGLQREENRGEEQDEDGATDWRVGKSKTVPLLNLSPRYCICGRVVKQIDGGRWGMKAAADDARRAKERRAEQSSSAPIIGMTQTQEPTHTYVPQQ